MYFPQNNSQYGVSSYFHFSLSVFLQVYYTFLKYIFPTASLLVFSSSVYSVATSSYNIILPITILFPFSVACLRKMFTFDCTIAFTFNRDYFPAIILYLSQYILPYSIISPPWSIQCQQ